MPQRRLSRRRRVVFATTAVALAIGLPGCALLAVDVYLHGKYQTSAGYNVWGYRGPVAGRKRPGEIRIVVAGGSTVYGYGVNWNESMPAQLERALAARSQRRFAVVNLGYNNEGAYSLKFTLRDYAHLRYDVAVLYESYNDLIMPPEKPNLSVFRHDSPVFRLTGYLPIFPIVFKEKAAAMLHGGDPNALYRDSGKTVFSPSVAQRAAAGVLTATAEVGQSLERQLDRMTAEPRRQVADAGSMGCALRWTSYCRSMFEAVKYAVDAGKLVIVVGQPYEPDGALRPRHMEQERDLAAMLARRFGGNPRVRFVDLGTAVDLTDPTLSFDQMHLTPEGNRRIADALVQPVLDIMSAAKIAVQTFDLVDKPIDSVSAEHRRAAAFAHRAPFGRIVEQAANGLGERADVTRRSEQTDAWIGNHVADAADVRADAGNSRGEAFNQRDRRAFVARRQQEDVGRRVNGRHVTAPSEKPRARADAEIASGPFDVAAQVAIAGDEKQRTRATLHHASRRLQEQPVVLDGGQAADGRDDLCVEGNVQRRASGGAVAIRQRGQRRQIKAEWNDAVLFRPADSMVIEELVSDLRRDGDDGIARACELALRRGERPLHRRTKIAFEHVPVVGVHNARGRRATGGPVVDERRETADRPGLRHVGVDDRGAEGAEQPRHLREGDRVLQWCDRTAQRRNVSGLHALVREHVAHVAFAGTETSVNQKRFEATIRQPFRQRHRLNGRPADVQPRDDSGDAHRSDNNTRLFPECPAVAG